MKAKRWTYEADGEEGSLWACSRRCAENAADMHGGTLGECQGGTWLVEVCEGGSLCPEESDEWLGD